MLGGCPARVRIPPWGGRERSADKSTCVKGMPLMNCKYLYVCWLSHLPYVNGGGGIAPFPPVAYLCIDVLPILKSAIRDPAERPVAWDFQAGSRFFVPSSVPLCIWETGWERLGPYRRAYAPFPFFCPYFSFSICISPRFVVSLHRQRKHACVSFFHFSSPSLPPKPGNGVPSGLNEPMKRPLLDCRSAQTSFQVWPFWMIVWAG